MDLWNLSDRSYEEGIPEDFLENLLLTRTCKESRKTEIERFYGSSGSQVLDNLIKDLYPLIKKKKFKLADKDPTAIRAYWLEGAEDPHSQKISIHFEISK